MLMAHKEFGFHHIPDGMKDQAISEGWFEVTDLSEAKAALYGTVQDVEEADKPRRGRKPKVQ